jgi:hypothetical protein
VERAGDPGGDRGGDCILEEIDRRGVAGAAAAATPRHEATWLDAACALARSLGVVVGISSSASKKWPFASSSVPSAHDDASVASSPSSADASNS